MTDTPVLSLAEEQRQVAHDRLIRAAWSVLATRGLGATTDEVADAAGVSVRTVFRHFGTRDHMVAESLRAQLRTFKDELRPPEPGDSLESWLVRLLLRVHQRNAVLGRAYWEMTALRSELSGEIGEAAEERRAARVQLVRRTANGAWHLAGNEGRAPTWVADAFAVHLSAFAAQALTADHGRSVDQVAAASAQVLGAVIRDASGPSGC